jgi:hypothetical protein
MKSFVSLGHLTIPLMRPLHDEHHGTKACHDTDSCSTLGAIKQKYANRHRAYQYIAESKRWESNDRQKERFCYRFNLTKGTDIATTFSIVKPTLQVFSSNLSPFVSGYGGLRTFV